MAVLYRKYRPQTFGEVLNQKAIIQTLKNQVKAGSVAHAYLFTGSRGVGKTSIARILAKAVNCQGYKDTRIQGYGDACGVCDVCKQIEAGNFLDLVEIDAASNTGVDNIRELIEHVRFAPSVGKYKVFIIDEVHMLSKGAFNALLKTLEEPPKHAIFILATTEINKVPATIISRTQKFDFKALSSADILEHLEKISKQENSGLKTEVLELVANNAEGSVRDALSLLDKVLTLGSEANLEEVQQLLGITDIATCENLLELIALGRAKEIPNFYNSISEKGLDYLILNRDFLEFLRKVLVFKITDSAADFGLPKEHKEKIASLAGALTAQDLIFIIRLFLKSYKDLQNSPSPQIPLLVASIEGAMRKAAGQGYKDTRIQANIETKLESSAIQKTEQPTVTSAMIEGDKAPSAFQSTDEPLMTMEEVESAWPKIITKIKDINGPLASMLKNSPLITVEGHRIVLSVKFTFDKHSLENAKNAALISTIIQSVCGKKMSVVGQVAKHQAPDVVGAAEAINDALKVFGGELVE